MRIPVLCISPYREWDNGVSGCVLIFNWDGKRPSFFLVDNDHRVTDYTSEVWNQSFTPEEEQWFDAFFKENGSLDTCYKFTTIADYHKYHFILLDRGLLADLLADCICMYLTSRYDFWYRTLETERLEQHLAESLSNNSVSYTIDSFQKALLAEDWRLSILKSAMSVFNCDLLIQNYIQESINQCIEHINKRLKTLEITELASVGEQLSIYMEQHPNDACWYRFVEDYLNNRASFKLLHCSKYSIRQVIAFASLAKYYAVHPSLETSFALEPLTPQERIAIFKMYFQNISDEELKVLNEQDDPLCYRLPTQMDAQISACNKMLNRCQFIPFWLPEEVRPIYENYEWAFRNYIRTVFHMDITNHLPSALSLPEPSSGSTTTAMFEHRKSDDSLSFSEKISRAIASIANYKEDNINLLIRFRADWIAVFVALVERNIVRDTQFTEGAAKITKALPPDYQYTPSADDLSKKSEIVNALRQRKTSKALKQTKLDQYEKIIQVFNSFIE